MKKIYFLIGMMVLTESAFAQQVNLPEYPHKNETKTTIRPSDQVSATHRQVIWSEDFENGIPATWNNNTVTGPVSWDYTTVGHEGNFPTDPIQSTSASNGWIIIDSDGDNFNGGGSEHAELTTEAIDCSGFPNIRVSFEQMFREWQGDSTYLCVSVDSFATRTCYHFNNGIGQAGTSNPDIQSFDITSAIAADPSHVQLRFVWKGEWEYGWQVDDVVIENIPNNDLRIKHPGIDSYLEYFQSPLSQIQAYDFSAKISNTGLSATSNTVLDVEINDGTNSVVITSPTINQSINQTDSFNAGTFTPSAQGTYNVTMVASSDSIDNQPDDNTLTTQFTVTECTYARDNGIDGGGLNNGQLAFELGLLYEMITTANATNIEIAMDERTVEGALIYGVLYKFDSADGFEYVSHTPDHTITASDIDNWVNLYFNTPVELTGGNEYIVCVGTYGSPQDTAVIERGSNAAPDQTSFILDGSDNTWYFTNNVPSIRLGVACPGPDGIEGIASNAVTVSQNNPNPFSNTTAINYSLSESGHVTFEVVDVTGKRVHIADEGSQAPGAYSFRFDASHLDAGIYFYSIITNKGRVTRQMMVNR